MVNVRTKIPPAVSAKLAYASSVTGIPKSEVYALSLAIVADGMDQESLASLLRTKKDGRQAIAIQGRFADVVIGG
jgi:hypothetical protein